MQFHHSRTAAGLVERLLSLWSDVREDPFSFDLAVVPGPGFQRWLSQQLATGGDEAGDGVCAGVEFCSLEVLERRLDGGDDPWRPQRLAWSVQQVALATDEPELEVLRRHLAASRETFTASRRIAQQFAGYARHRPAMLAAWAAGGDTGPDGAALGENAWQAHLYRLLVAELGESPLDRREALVQRLRDAAVDGLPHRVAVLAPRRLDAPVLEVLDALGSHHQLDVLLLTPTPSRRPLPGSSTLRRAEFARPPGHPLNEALAAVADEAALLVPALRDAPSSLGRSSGSDTGAPSSLGRSSGSDTSETLPEELREERAKRHEGEERARRHEGPAPHQAPDSHKAPHTLLARLQSDLRADLQRPALRKLDENDRSLQVHLSHGRDRQVEVLREVLTGLLADDPTLEPRHIAILTPDVDAFAPLLTAAFTAPAGTPNHPAQRFRVLVADRSVAQVNPTAALLLDLLRLPDTRVEASALLELCAQPGVAARFGLGGDARDRLVELVQRAGVRWGLSAAQREGYGLSGFPQNTWFAGLQRMLLGVALGETDLVTTGTVLPLDDVESSDVSLIGGLTELVGRLSRLLTEFAAPAPLTEWTQRCRAALSDLVALPPAQEWQLADVWTGLARLAERGAGAGTTLSRHAALRAIEEEFTSAPARGAFGNGSLVVCGLRSLRHVPHRVVVLLGWDAACYPRSARRHGDDLLGVEPLVGDPSAALADRQALLDAVHAATETLVVVAQGRSEATNEEVPLAAPVAELLEALDLTAVAADGRPAAAAVTVHHPLQPFDPRYFDPACPALRSADPLAFHAARATLAEPVVPRGRYVLQPLPEPELTRGVGLDELVGFFANPARALLRARTGVSFADTPDPGDAIPIELPGLARWQVGNRVLQRLRAGASPAAVAKAEWLRGEVPPFALGQAVLDGVLDEARRSVREVAPSLPEPVLHDLALSVPVPGHGNVPLVGRVATHGAELLQVEFSSLQPRHRLSAWLRLLVLAAGESGVWRARVVGKGRRVVYEAPPAAAALDLLGRYLALYALGLSRPLPASPRLGFAWAEYRVSQRDPEDRLVSRKNFDRCWEYDSDDHWRAFFRYPDVLSLPAGDPPVPGADPGERTLVGALASSIWAPVMAAEVPA
jgi:exodeoxyribonuclease V gamma subunit